MDSIYDYLKNKKIILLGFGKSNLAIANILDDLRINFEIRDKKDCSDKLNFKNSKVNHIFGENYSKNLDCDIIFRSPGIRPDIEGINLAVQKGAILSSEIDLFMQFCPSKNVFVVTGSDGKSTTTSLIYEILKSSGKNVFLGGNIGISIISQLDKISHNSYVVLELSSFQLIHSNINPKIAVISNISENHLDWHLSFDEYISSKFNIFKNNPELLVINDDDSILNKLKVSNIRSFSLNNKVENGCYLNKNGDIIFSDHGEESKIINCQDIKIPGIHNIYNYMASISACFDFVSIDDIKHVAQNFTGLSHRIEFVDEINGVKYYNDSIASTPNRVIKGSLSVFQDNIVLIAGGYDKHLEFDKFADVVCNKVKVIILTGQTSDKIEKCINNSNFVKKPKIFKANSMVDAVNLARSNSVANDIVLLSPACASFGMYNNFEERGMDFKRCVLNLREVYGD